mmetsp:Transcript_9039/g.26807  ORF Transcript_9039/g.26807 Transcript_9039/m.26807 type:complete len:217 (+) Transcript_9039:601-1251(+)
MPAASGEPLLLLHDPRSLERVCGRRAQGGVLADDRVVESGSRRREDSDDAVGPGREEVHHPGVHQETEVRHVLPHHGPQVPGRHVLLVARLPLARGDGQVPGLHPELGGSDLRAGHQLADLRLRHPPGHQDVDRLPLPPAAERAGRLQELVRDEAGPAESLPVPHGFLLDRRALRPGAVHVLPAGDPELPLGRGGALRDLLPGDDDLRRLDRPRGE